MHASTVQFLTFLCAMVGYAGLAAMVIQSARFPLLVWIWRPIALLIALHVLLVWAFRYEWHLAQATRNGYIGFGLFHTALLVILISTLLHPERAVILLRVAFLIVSVGAIGAVFRYNEVAIYRVPVLLGAVLGGAGFALAMTNPRRRNGA